LDEEYPVPSNEELCELWTTYQPGKQALPLERVYGVHNPPASPPRGIASIDLCEVIRDTAVALDMATGVSLGRRHIYSTDTWFDKSERGKDYETSVVVSIIRAAMDEGLVRPVDDIQAIRRIIEDWHQQGIYCVANTSTLPGCERGTIAHTLARDLSGCFDALVLPRNHDGTGTVTKATALDLLAEQAGLDVDSLPMVHIDDAPHHIADFQTYYSNSSRLKLFSPVNATNSHILSDMHCTSPLQAFERANEYLMAEVSR
jgi:hypothetical protein